MANFGDIIAGVGALAGGAAEGLQVGSQLRNQSEILKLEQQRANLDKINNLAAIMDIPDSAVREFALNQLLPMMDIDPKSPQGQSLIKLNNSMSDETRQMLTAALRRAGVIDEGETAPEDLLRSMLKDPTKAILDLQKLAMEGRSETRLEEQLGLEREKFTHDVEQDTAELDLARSQERREAAETQADIAAKETERRLNEEKLNRLVQGLGLTKSELIGFALNRSEGKLTEDMPDLIKNMSEEAAATFHDTLTKPSIQVGSDGTVRTKAAHDRIVTDIAHMDTTINMLNTTLDILERSPEAAGLVGTTVRFGQRAAGAIKSFVDAAQNTTSIRSEAQQQIVKSFPFVDGETRVAVSKFLTNKDVSTTEVLEAAMALSYARDQGVSSRVNKDQYDAAVRAVSLTGLTGRDQVMQRLQAIRDNVLTPYRESLQNLIDTGQEGTLPPPEEPTEELNLDEIDDEDLRKILEGEQ